VLTYTVRRGYKRGYWYIYNPQGSAVEESSTKRRALKLAAEYAAQGRPVRDSFGNWLRERGA
jgi:hypothetical protein